MTKEFHRTNINLRHSDYIFLLSRFGSGWTTEVREIVARAVDELKSEPVTIKMPTQEPPDETDVNR